MCIKNKPYEYRNSNLTRSITFSKIFARVQWLLLVLYSTIFAEKGLEISTN